MPEVGVTATPFVMVVPPGQVPVEWTIRLRPENPVGSEKVGVSAPPLKKVAAPPPQLKMREPAVPGRIGVVTVEVTVAQSPPVAVPGNVND